MCVQSLSRVRLCDAMDCGTPGSSVHGIFWARIQPFFDINILWASADKESTCNAGDPSLISGSESFPGEGDKLPTPVFLGFLSGSDGKESACNAGDLGSIPGLGRSPGGGHGNPLQLSCLENPHGQRSLTGCSPWVHKESDMTG